MKSDGSRMGLLPKVCKNMFDGDTVRDMPARRKDRDGTEPVSCRPLGGFKESEGKRRVVSN